MYFHFVLCEVVTSSQRAFKSFIEKFLGPSKSFRVLIVLEFCFYRLLILSNLVVPQYQLHWKAMETIVKNWILWKAETRIRLLSTEAASAGVLCEKCVLSCQVSMLWRLADLFLIKRLLSQETVFLVPFTWDKNRFIIPEVQVFWLKKYLIALFNSSA